MLINSADASLFMTDGIREKHNEVFSYNNKIRKILIIYLMRNRFFLFCDFHHTFTIQAGICRTLMNLNGLEPDGSLEDYIVNTSAYKKF